MMLCAELGGNLFFLRLKKVELLNKSTTMVEQGSVGRNLLKIMLEGESPSTRYPTQNREVMMMYLLFNVKMITKQIHAKHHN